MGALGTLALRNVRTGFLRFAATLAAIALSVGFVVGTNVFANTLQRTFDDLFSDTFAGTDAYVRSTDVVSLRGFEQRARLDASLVERVRGVDGVAAAEGSVFGYAGMLNKDGKFVNPPSAAPMFGQGWVANPELSPWRIVDGRAPQRPGEIAIDRITAKRTGYAVGDTVRVATKGEPQAFTLVGIAKFGNADGQAGAAITLFSPEDAMNLVAEPGKVDGFLVLAEAGISQEDLAVRLGAALPDGIEAITGAQLTKENQDAVGQFVSILGTVLLGFALVSALVGAFVIWNTFSVLLAQRVRQLALLRAIGAGRGQLTRSTLIEAFVIGVTGTVLGVGVGVLLAKGIRVLFNAFAGELPGGPTVITPLTLVLAVLVGVGVTVACAAWPAFRATGVPPVTAMRNVAYERRGRVRLRAVLGSGLLVIAIAGVTLSTIAAEPALLGLFVVVTLVAVVVAGPLLADTLGALIGAPIARTGTQGRLGARNAVRNPRRTASTAFALTLGAMLVSGFTLLGAALRDQINREITASVRSDLLVDASGPGFGGLSPKFAEEARALPEIGDVSVMRFSVARIEGKAEFITAMSLDVADRFWGFGERQGDLAAVGDDGLAVRRSVAEERGWRLGTKVPVEFPVGGVQQFTVRSIFEGSQFVQGIAVTTAVFDRFVPDNFDGFVQLNVADGVSPDAARRAVEPVLAKYGSFELQDIAEYRESISAQINQILVLLYALLALAVVIAVLGIVNTLGLSVIERTRELGLTRAVGATRRQLRAMITWESVIVAVLGSVLGIVLGIALGSAFVFSLRNDGIDRFEIPWGSMAVLLVLAGLVGVLAAYLPGRRAAKLDVLDSIATE